MRTIIIYSTILFMMGCSAPHHNTVANNSAQQLTATQPIKVKDCKDCEEVKQFIEAHFFRNVLEYKSPKADGNRVYRRDTVYYSSVNFDSLIHSPIVQKCFYGKCFTNADALYMFGNDIHYNGGNYIYGYRLPFTTSKNCPKCNLVLNSDFHFGIDEQGFITSIELTKYVPANDNIQITNDK